MVLPSVIVRLRFPRVGGKRFEAVSLWMGLSVCVNYKGNVCHMENMMYLFAGVGERDIFVS